jgi:hypothetical protein
MFKHLEALTTNSLIMCQTKKAKTLREDRTLSVRHEEPTGPDEAEVRNRYLNSLISITSQSKKKKAASRSGGDI